MFAHQPTDASAFRTQHQSDIAHRDGLGTYLATSDPRNVPFYERAGFSAVGGVDLGGPRLTVLHGV